MPLNPLCLLSVLFLCKLQLFKFWINCLIHACHSVLFWQMIGLCFFDPSGNAGSFWDAALVLCSGVAGRTEKWVSLKDGAFGMIQSHLLVVIPLAYCLIQDCPDNGLQCKWKTVFVDSPFLYLTVLIGSMFINEFISALLFNFSYVFLFHHSYQ